MSKPSKSHSKSKNKRAAAAGTQAPMTVEAVDATADGWPVPAEILAEGSAAFGASRGATNDVADEGDSDGSLPRGATFADGAPDTVMDGEVDEISALQAAAEAINEAAFDADGEVSAHADLAETAAVIDELGELNALDGAEAGDVLDADGIEVIEGEAGVSLPTSAASMDDTQLTALLEALIFAADRPVTMLRLRQLTRIADVARLAACLDKLAASYQGRGIQLQQVSGGYQLRTQTVYSAWVQQLIAGRPVKLTRAQLETLALVAYRQPITRPEIDDIRGVDSSNTLRVLMERGLVRSLGKKEEVGRPTLFGTTKEFLDFFSLGDLRELPTLREYSELTDESRATMTKLGVEVDDPIPAATAPSAEAEAMVADVVAAAAEQGDVPVEETLEASASTDETDGVPMDAAEQVDEVIEAAADAEVDDTLEAAADAAPEVEETLEAAADAEVDDTLEAAAEAAPEVEETLEAAADEVLEAVSEPEPEPEPEPDSADLLVASEDSPDDVLEAIADLDEPAVFDDHDALDERTLDAADDAVIADTVGTVEQDEFADADAGSDDGGYL